MLTLLLTIAVAIFAVGNTFRVAKILRVPKPLRWELYPIPKGPRERQRYGGSYFEDTAWWTKPQTSDHGGELAFMAREVLLLTSVREGFRGLWSWSWLLHWGLYLYIAATACGVASLFSASPGLRSTTILGYLLACSLGLVGSLGLLGLRLSHPRLRHFTGRVSILNLLLLAAIFVTGIGSSATGRALVDAASAKLPASPVLYSHVILVAFFLAYFPFTHMTHAYMKFFTWHSVRWDDSPAMRDRDFASQLAANLQRPVSWAAPHIAEGGAAAWAEVVAESGVQRDGKHA